MPESENYSQIMEEGAFHNAVWVIEQAIKCGWLDEVVWAMDTTLLSKFVDAAITRLHR